MPDVSDQKRAELSVVLTTDTRETIHGVLRRLQNQTAQALTEIIMVVPRGQAGAFTESDAQGFADFRIVEVEEICPLARARDAGVRASSAPLVFLGETHAYPHPDWAEAMIAANHRGTWGAIAPGFRNANPRRALSWAGFLADYGRWGAGLPPAEIGEAPLFNRAYRRSALLEMGNRLEPSLAHGDELPATLRKRGYRVYFASDARIDHLNVAQPRHWLREVFLTGMIVGGRRAHRWSPAKRVAYVLGSPLIPVVLSFRILGGIRKLPSSQSAPMAAYLLILLGTVVRAAGELIGYVRGIDLQTETRAEVYELHKMAFAADREA
jgi:GT2 family glycosyltransferase